MCFKYNFGVVPVFLPQAIHLIIIKLIVISLLFEKENVGRLPTFI